MSHHSTAEPISVLVADDSALVRRLISQVLDSAPGIRVIGTAVDGENALEQVARLRPDIVTLDVEMPVMDGLTAMRLIRRRFPRLPVIMVSTLTQRGASITLDALAAGARDYVTKPSNSGSLAGSLADLRSQLVPRIRALTRPRPTVAAAPAVADNPRAAGDSGGGPVGRAAPTTRAAGSAAGSKRTAATGGGNAARIGGTPQIVAIGASTGGPDALSQIISAFRQAPPVPIVAVQHMPPVFTELLAGRLDKLGPATVVEAEDGQQLMAGTVYIAPGGRHLAVQRRGAGVFTALHDGDPENFSRPSVDVLFRSVARTYSRTAIGVVLTGMGHDGRDGARELWESGGYVIAQDEASSVVWGMPGAVYHAGAADAVLDISQIGPTLVSHLSAGRQASGAV